MYPTDQTVSAVIEDNGRYLLVEEHAMGEVVLNQPGGHIEAGESPEEAVVREVVEETGCKVACGELIGVYLWIHPQTRQQFLRLAYYRHLGRRLNTYIEFRHVREDLRTHAESFCIADETALVYRLQANRWEGIADTYEPAVAKLYGKMFDEIWLASEVEIEFRQLGV